MQNVMGKIVEWGKNQSYWEQVAFDRIIAGEPFTEEVYERLLQLLLEEEGLADKTIHRETPRFHQYSAAGGDSISPVRLKKITKLQNINALATNQTLTFGPVITAIYGENGSGKSGYARVLGSAGFTRGDTEVLPDVTKPKAKDATLSAEIQVSVDGNEQTLHYQVGHPCPELASFYVFDSTSVRVHMSEQNPLSFSPAGLTFLKRLADETDQVRIRLAKKIGECNYSCECVSVFQGDSTVSRMLTALGPDTDLDQLKELTKLTPEENKKRHELAIQIANFELDKIKAQIDDLKNKITTLEKFQTQLNQAQEQLSLSRVQEIRQTVSQHIAYRDAAALAGADQFANPRFKGVGSGTWKEFVEAAKKLAEYETKAGNSYPQPGDFCLLCHQPLTDEAYHLVINLWEYLRGQAQQAFVTSARLIAAELDKLNEIALFNPGNDCSLPYQIIGEYDKKLLGRLKTQVESFRERFINTKRNLTSLTSTITYTEPENCQKDLIHLIEQLKQNLANLEATKPEEEIKRLEDQKRELDHRVMLAPLYPTIQSYVEKQRWARGAKKVGGSTRHITVKHNELFKELVTDKYIKIFSTILLNMGRPLKVKIETIGKKGQTLKQVVLEAAADAKDFARPEKVLSEGEKRAVALADYLTEVELDTASNGIILDDPVTSLDLEWRETIADMLVQKADKRQVIIFTHDLPFLYLLKKKAEFCGKPISTHWVKRGGRDDRPGYVYLDNSPALERDYRKPTRAMELYTKAKSADPEGQESILHEGFGALRTCYEAFIIFDMLEEVVMRFNERVSFGRLKDIRWDPVIAVDVIESCERLSTLIEGHLHSDALMATKPKPEKLLQEIQHFEELQKRLKKIKSNK